MKIELSKGIDQTLMQIDHAFENGDGYKIIQDIILVKRFVGVVLAKALWLGKRYWNNPDESFRNFAVKNYGIKSETIKRYIDTWDAIEKAPEKLKEYLIRKPMEELIPIGTNIANGEINPDEDEWEKLMLTNSNGEVYELIREMTGKQRNEKIINLYIDPDTGEISSWQNDHREYIGFLDVERMDVEQVSKSINRIIRKAGLREKNNA